MPQQDFETTVRLFLLPVRAFRGLLWDLLRDSLPEERHEELWAELVRKHSHHSDLSQSR